MTAEPIPSSASANSPMSGLQPSGSSSTEQAKDDDIVRVELTQQQDYRFTVAFGGDVPPLNIDEPAPLGAGTGPSPLQLLAASVGSCLSDSLLFALRKFKQHPDPVTCSVEARLVRNEQKRLRVGALHAVLTLGVPAASIEHLDRVLDQFGSFCTVTQSVGQGISISVEVWDATGTKLK